MKRIKWFEDARFGMFIHWGLYSILGRECWVMELEQIPRDEYALLAKKFNPGKFDANKWVALAKEAGMKYCVLTTRHHDGFCLFDSKVSDFTSVKTAAKRDFVAEYVKSCRKHGMNIGFYYSLLDWRFPAYHRGPKKDPKGFRDVVKQAHAQVEELMTDYGKVDYLWYDGEWIPDVEFNRSVTEPGKSPQIARYWRADELNKMVRKLQPHIVINNRTGLGEDVDSPEQNIVASEEGRPWESCMTMNDNWGYTKADNNWKTTRHLIQNLVCCVSGGGNFLLNVGPKPNGEIPAPSIKRLKEIGRWMDVNKESIYGCGKGPFGGGTVGFTTAKGNIVYLHVLRWPGKEICIARVNKKVESSYLLSTKKKVSVTQKGERLFFKDLPGKPLDPYDTVICSILK